jgi:hypothetical protein
VVEPRRKTFVAQAFQMRQPAFSEQSFGKRQVEAVEADGQDPVQRPPP